jgi:hypothetical protein
MDSNRSSFAKLSLHCVYIKVDFSKSQSYLLFLDGRNSICAGQVVIRKHIGLNKAPFDIISGSFQQREAKKQTIIKQHY